MQLTTPHQNLGKTKTCLTEIVGELSIVEEYDRPSDHTKVDELYS